jgi:hypothetical protein
MTWGMRVKHCPLLPRALELLNNNDFLARHTSLTAGVTLLALMPSGPNDRQGARPWL